MNQDRFKFRAWAKAWGEHTMSEPFDLNDIPLFPPHRATLGGEYTMDMVLMQSTGLRDKNDKLIFEGDIIRDKLSYTYTVEFQDNEFCTFSIKWQGVNGKISFHSFKGCEDMEIIGNIYENSELLTNETKGTNK